MKKLVYLLGFIGSVIFALGVTSKLLSWPWGNELFIVGFLVLILIFIPLFAFDKFKVANSGILYERLKIILGGTSAVIIGISGIFKIMHLQGAAILLILGTSIFVLGFLPLFFYSLYKKSIA